MEIFIDVRVLDDGGYKGITIYGILEDGARPTKK